MGFDQRAEVEEEEVAEQPSGVIVLAIAVVREKIKFMKFMVIC